MQLNELTAISPADGRYRKHSEILSEYFSEFALIRFRVKVEVEYLIILLEQGIKGVPSIKEDEKKQLRNLYLNFSLNQALRIKEIEKTTNHDVKAVEYFIKENVSDKNAAYVEYIHFGLTSQDINNTAIPLSLKDSHQNVFEPAIKEIISKLNAFAKEWESVAMLSRTHGQPASPTLLGKEIKVFSERLEKQFTLINSIPWSAKFGGATGNLNAHQVAFPDFDWVKFSNHFVNEILKLNRSQTTTQIEHYDNLAAYFDNIKRINTILIDLCRDIWSYISMDYFKQKLKEGEIGSSAMPHKVNPIDFENAEGNLGIANAIFEHLSAKLPVSRLQRDLTDSTVLRTIGVPLAHTLIAIKSLQKGLDKLILNPAKLEEDLENNWAVVAEAIQTILRRENFPKPYEALKDLTRTNSKINRESIHNFIDGLNVSNEIKSELKKISPHNYTGVKRK